MVGWLSHSSSALPVTKATGHVTSLHVTCSQAGRQGLLPSLFKFPPSFTLPSSCKILSAPTSNTHHPALSSSDKIAGDPATSWMFCWLLVTTQTTPGSSTTTCSPQWVKYAAGVGGQWVVCEAQVEMRRVRPPVFTLTCRSVLTTSPVPSLPQW